MSDERHAVVIRMSAFEFLRNLKNPDAVLLIDFLGEMKTEEADFSEVRGDGVVIYSMLHGDFVVDFYYEPSSRQIRVENIGFADDGHDVDDFI